MLAEKTIEDMVVMIPLRNSNAQHVIWLNKHSQEIDIEDNK